MFLVIIAICSVIAVLTWQRRPKNGARTLTGVMVGLVIWNLGFLGQTLPLGFAFQRAVIPVNYLGVTITVMMTFLLGLEYAGFEGWVNRKTVALLLVEPILTVSMSAINPYGLFFSLDPTKPLYNGMAVSYDIAFFVHTLYSYVLLGSAVVFVLYRTYRSGELYQRQGIAIMIAILAPLTANGLWIAGFTSSVAQSPGFAITGIALFVGLFRLRLVDVAPVARAIVMDEIDAGVVVLDDDDVLVDINPVATEMLGLDDEQVIGRPIAELVRPELLSRFDSDEIDDEVEVSTPAGRRFIQVRATSFSAGLIDSEEAYGRVFLLNDITERRERERKLRRQNEHLDEFASLVSHDLRNPLSVAEGFLEMGLEELDDETVEDHLAYVEQSHDRMGNIIDDVLTLARQGQQLTERTPVELAELAADTWKGVETDDATLEVQSRRTVMGDRRRLRHVFENLFRNAVDHGPADVTVRVQDVSPDSQDPLSAERGFAVEDDGPGIPEDERDDVLESGYTTADDGTGLGLSIVASVVEAHGWDVSVAESPEGGARFVVTGVGQSTSQDGDSGPGDSQESERRPNAAEQTEATRSAGIDRYGGSATLD
jgi:PAS domain S-box-containing protein